MPQDTKKLAPLVLPRGVLLPHDTRRRRYRGRGRDERQRLGHHATARYLAFEILLRGLSLLRTSLKMLVRNEEQSIHLTAINSSDQNCG